MTRGSIAEYDKLLLEASVRLVDDYAGHLLAGRVIAAIVQSKKRVRDSFTALGLDLPPIDEYVLLVVALARQELDRGSDHRRPD